MSTPVRPVRPPEERLLPDDDLSLALAASRGDQRSFGRLIRRHDDRMRGVVYRVTGSQAAMDDVLQEAYLKAWQAIASFRGDSAFSTWLYTIVHRCSIDHHRRRGRLRAVDDLDQPVEDHAGSIASSMALQSALAALPADQLAVVTLIDGEGRSYDEVAAMLDISSGTVGSRLHRARASLRAALDSSGGMTEGERR